MFFSPSTKTGFQVPCKPSRAAPRLNRRPPAAWSWRLYNPVSLTALFPDNHFFVIFCNCAYLVELKGVKPSPDKALRLTQKMNNDSLLEGSRHGLS
jgi:hypothetical protein